MAHDRKASGYSVLKGAMLVNNLLAVVVLSSVLLNAEDFSLSANGIGPITVHSELAYEGSGVRLVATIKNDSGQSLGYADLCVKPSGRENCLYEMRNKETVGPGEVLTFNMIFADHVPLVHRVTIRDLKLSSVQASPSPPAVAQAVPIAPIASPQPATAPPNQPDSPVAVGALGKFIKGTRGFAQGVESHLDPEIKLAKQTEADTNQREKDRLAETIREQKIAEERAQRAEDRGEAARKFDEAIVLRAQGLTRQNRGLTNDSILKLVKAGLGDDVIVGMVNSQPGEYAVDSDSVIAMKQAGVSDRVIAAVIGKVTGQVGTSPLPPTSPVPEPSANTSSKPPVVR